MEVLRKLIRSVLAEEIGRNYHTVDDSPHTFRSFQGYDIEINPVENGRYQLELKFYGKKISDSKMFTNYAEAENAARIMIDSHRVKFMNATR